MTALATQVSDTDNHSILLSRFFMHDLIKITSRRSTTKVITFYYRIPKYEEYLQNEQALEVDIANRLFLKPAIPYTFAFKRDRFEEVSMSFEFENEDQAKLCIQVVSNLYKKLKMQNRKKATSSNNTSTGNNLLVASIPATFSVQNKSKQ